MTDLDLDAIDARANNDSAVAYKRVQLKRTDVLALTARIRALEALVRLANHDGVFTNNGKNGEWTTWAFGGDDGATEADVTPDQAALLREVLDR